MSQQEHVSADRVAGPWGEDTFEGGVLDTPESLDSLIELQVLVGHLQGEWILLLANSQITMISLHAIKYSLVLFGVICHLHCVLKLHNCGHNATNVVHIQFQFEQCTCHSCERLL